MGIAFANVPLAFVRTAFLAAFGEEPLLVRQGVVDQLDVVELVGDIPDEDRRQIPIRTALGYDRKFRQTKGRVLCGAELT